MKKVGIACDNYKVETYKAELTKRKFTDFKVLDGLTPDMKIIQVTTEDNRVDTIKKICEELEGYFKRAKRDN